jgi:hypothetical protein
MHAGISSRWMALEYLSLCRVVNAVQETGGWMQNSDPHW